MATPFLDALFTSTSAVCVTGLVLHDTASYWSDFGQLIIMLLIQIGGMGVITVAASLAMVSGRKISLMQRSTMQEAIAAPKVGGIVKLTNFIVKAALLVELLGAAVMAPIFCRDFGIRGLWMALFHSVSAFCNAGFDLMGTKEAFSSLTAYADEPVVNLAVILLIIVGGIGFLTWMIFAQTSCIYISTECKARSFSVRRQSFWLPRSFTFTFVNMLPLRLARGF